MKKIEAKKKKKPQPARLKVDTYAVLSDKVWEGCLAATWNESLSIPKDQADAEVIADKIYNRVMGSICEYFEF